ncbi:Acyl-CoA-binding protein, ACBP [Niveomyces insectorum RCEF 264]|uniref:Acyl-CoA-binding protein, ACBP n=1 Tax=Niveomyces insectorum RCEF 264 TaxID=1081102 RepID=A0A167QYD8_9HYPO|nr:Acyl-CoA-binding protein, ACBP [Niveomyces insectorum RCEF 264]
MSVPQSEAFQKAVVDSKKLTSKPTNEELLDIYGLFKVATGEDITKAPTPGMFDLKGKAKKNAWQKVVDEGLTPEQAQERYVEYIEKLKATHGYDPEKVPETVGSS